MTTATLPDMLCECGCGEPAGVYLRTNVVYGQIADEPRRFIPHHHQRAARHHKWNGGKRNADGYVEVRRGSGYKKEHIVIAENALGHPLPASAIVHHVNEKRSDNHNRNLVICHNQAYHLLLHQRMRARAATGNAHSVKCSHCNKWGTTGVDGMRTKKSGRSYHLPCNTSYEEARRRKDGAACQS